MKFDLGSSKRCDLDKLIRTRMLVQANSGGGKSWCLRRILEQTHGRVQQLVIDPEGEFATLREKFDYVIAARHGGDTVADPRAAKLLAERLLQLGISAILDIYELKAHERIRFVRLFLEALVDAPKDLWHPVLVVVDEAHTYCPQKGEAESAGAVIDLCTRGRKRGFCAVLATQRLSKLHKDAAAELNNKLIGRTGLDVDMKRAAEELGFSGKEEMLTLRSLGDGEFFAFGPAIAQQVIRLTTGPVQTTHPEAGGKAKIVAPPPTAKVKALLPQLADLPAEAEQKQRTEAELKKDLATARATITRLERAAPVQTSAPKNATELRQAQAGIRELQAHKEKLTSALERLMKFIVEINAQDFFKAGGEAIDQQAIQKAIDSATQQAVKLIEQDLSRRRKAFETWRHQGDQILAQISRLVKQDVTVRVAVKHNEPFTVSPTLPAGRPPRTPPPVDGAFRATGPHQRILDALAWLDIMGITQPIKAQVAAVAKYAPGGAFYNPLGELRTAGLVEYPVSGLVTLTEAGRQVATFPDAPGTTRDMHEIVLATLDGPQKRILTPLLDTWPTPITKADLATAAGYAPGGAFYNPLGSLRTRGLVEYRSGGLVVAAAILFPEGNGR